MLSIIIPTFNEERWLPVLLKSIKNQQYQNIEIIVADNADGIPPNEFGNLFTAFFTTRDDGLGVGLAISKAIVEAHGGQIWAVAAPEGGTEFRFTIPVDEASDDMSK